MTQLTKEELLQLKNASKSVYDGSVNIYSVDPEVLESAYRKIEVICTEEEAPAQKEDQLIEKIKNLKETKRNYDQVLTELESVEDWQWALNEMRDETNEKFFGAISQVFEAIDKL